MVRYKIFIDPQDCGRIEKREQIVKVLRFLQVLF